MCAELPGELLVTVIPLVALGNVSTVTSWPDPLIVIDDGADGLVYEIPVANLYVPGGNSIQTWPVRLALTALENALELSLVLVGSPPKSMMFLHAE